MLARAANDIGVPFYRLNCGGQQFLQLGQGCHLRLCRETLTDHTPLFAQWANHKEGLHALLQHRGIPLPSQVGVDSLEQALAAAEQVGWPVVLKPADGGKGRGVWVGLDHPDALRQAWEAQHRQGGARQLVQHCLQGADHRLLVVEGHLLEVAQRQPASLVSDGQRPLREQIVRLNAEPDRGVAYERLRNRIPFDPRLDQLLADQGFSLDGVPPAGTAVQLSRTANISQGGTAIDCSQEVHPDNRRLAEDIAQLIGADVVGLDMISRDISVSWREGGTWLLEANLSPGLRPHLVANPSSDLCHRIVRCWMGDAPRGGRVPTALITGSIGKTTTTRMLAHLLQRTGLRVGLTSTTGMELDGVVIAQGDLAGGGPALHLLQDRRVEALVAEVARGAILKAGLGIAPGDVAAVLNVLDNHVGNDGIRSRQDLARIKAVVAQVAETLLVLNADDPLVLAMAGTRHPDSVAFVSEEPCCAAWHAHRRAGHSAICYSRGRDGTIQLYQAGELLISIALREIPAADDGVIGTIAVAAAFSAALAHGMGLDANAIVEGLRAYGLQRNHRRGRFEILKREPWQLVLAWADGPEAMASLSSYVQAATESAPRRRVLLCSAPDNRPDAFLRQVGQATWGFDLVIVASWDKRKGRPAGEVSALLAEGVRSLGPGGPKVLRVGTESDAVGVLAEQIRPGDLCVVCSYESELMRQQLLTALG
ncbi:Mur ligase family protein [Synechococcus sp. 1G10]|uniref:Mur ligase family protein n=1 Tax=Synechococcus sp. 1G10 TaxID=2025605 RepID=UPI001303C504|nr:Mur ligase family protein [Synechococcus sp. 1G10]